MTANKLGMLRGTPGLVESSSLGSPTGGTPDSAFHWQQVGAAISCFVTAVDKHTLAQAASTDKERTSKGHVTKLPEWIQKMVINTSEPIPDGTTDDNGDPVTDHTTFMASYQQFLDQPSLGAAKQFLDHYLNNKKCCSANIPLLTCVALYSGSLQWMGVMKPEAFSVLSCYHLGNLHVMSSMEAAGLHLKSTEGFGLSAANVAKATKILLLAPTLMVILAKMCAVFSMLLALTLGEKAPAMTAFWNSAMIFVTMRSHIGCEPWRMQPSHCKWPYTWIDASNST